MAAAGLAGASVTFERKNPGDTNFANFANFVTLRPARHKRRDSDRG